MNINVVRPFQKSAKISHFDCVFMQYILEYSHHSVENSLHECLIQIDCKFLFITNFEIDERCEIF